MLDSKASLKMLFSQKHVKYFISVDIFKIWLFSSGMVRFCEKAIQMHITLPKEIIEYIINKYAKISSTVNIIKNIDKIFFVDDRSSSSTDTLTPNGFLQICFRSNLYHLPSSYQKCKKCVSQGFPAYYSYDIKFNENDHCLLYMIESVDHKHVIYTVNLHSFCLLIDKELYKTEYAVIFMLWKEFCLLMNIVENLRIIFKKNDCDGKNKSIVKKIYCKAKKLIA